MRASPRGVLGSGAAQPCSAHLRQTEPLALADDNRAGGMFDERLAQRPRDLPACFVSVEQMRRDRRARCSTPGAV